MATSLDYATSREPHEAAGGEHGLAHLFGAPFLSRVWPDSDELNQDLRRRILARERDATSRSVTKSNVGGWQSDSGGLEWCGDAGKVLGTWMLAMANEATRQLLILHGGQLPGFRWIVEAWANVNRTGDFNQPHVHGGSTWSGTYYVDPGEPAADSQHGTALCLIDPAQSGVRTFFPRSGTGKVLHPAGSGKDGALSVLPASHGVRSSGKAPAYFHRIQSAKRTVPLIPAEPAPCERPP